MLETRQLIIRDLVDRGSIAEHDIADAHRHASTNQTTLLQSLVELGRSSHRELALSRARVSEHPFVDLNQFTTDLDNASLLPKSLAERAGVFPIFVVDGVATVAMLDPLDLQSLELIRQATHHEIEPVVCEEPLLRELIRKAYSDHGACQTNQATESSAGVEQKAQATPSVKSREAFVPDYERQLTDAATRTSGLTLITAAIRTASTARLHAFCADPINHKGQTTTLKRIAGEIDETEGPIYIDGLDDDLTARAAADAALGGRHVIATMTAADALDVIDRLRVSGVTQRTLDAIEIAVFHVATTPDYVHAIVDVAGHPIYQRTPTANTTRDPAADSNSRRLSA